MWLGQFVSVHVSFWHNIHGIIPVIQNFEHERFRMKPFVLL